MSSYQDIIDLSRPKSKHPSMSLNNRTAQFAPFSALTGYDEKIKEVARETAPKKELEEDQKEIINMKLQFLLRHKDEEIVAEILYFEKDKKKSGGSYHRVKKVVKSVDAIKREVVLANGVRIKIDMIVNIIF